MIAMADRQISIPNIPIERDEDSATLQRFLDGDEIAFARKCSRPTSVSDIS